MVNIKSAGLIAGPVVFLVFSNITPIEGLDASAQDVLAIAGWMIIWWITEAIPIPATALLPLILFPLTEVFSVRDAATPYASPVIFLFMGGFLIALALEKHKLHRRFALNLIRLTGTHANGIILGFMIATALLSMWISNTATTVMMLPIALSVVELLRGSESDQGGHKAFNLFALGLFLSIAYAANIGGAATIIGTPPNVVLVGFLDQMHDYELEFSRWLLIGLPIAITLIILTYLLITRILYPSRLGRIEGASALIRKDLAEMGKFSKEEKLVSAVFLLTAIGWVFKNPINEYLIGKDLLNDTVTAMTGGLLMFIVPANLSEKKFLLTWKDTARLPWGILILFGGGISLAKGMENTGIIQLIGANIAEVGAIQLWLLLFLMTGVALFMTEVMSNVALTTMFVPVAIGIADGLDLSPLLLAIPVTLAASCAFMMPISTPPNAIVFASGYIRMKDMMKAGIVLNIISILILLLASLTIIQWVYLS